MKQPKLPLTLVLSALLVLTLINACTKTETPNNTTSVPVLTTTSTSSITQTSAQTGGNISADGGASITARGVCWSTSQSPTISNNKTSDGTGIGSFSSSMTGLSANTTYYIRAYATNSAGTAYGNEISFTTFQIVGSPTLTTTSATNITQTTAQSGGVISADGGATIIARGICWNTSQNPTIANSKTSDGTGTGAFISSLTGLTANTTYYLRAYATNSSGTAYGNELSFTSTTNCTQVWMTTNLSVTNYRNGDPIPQVTDATQWANLTTGAWCYYQNNTANGIVYGKLYNWYAVNDPRGLAPTGWHLPSVAELTTLSTCMGGDALSGGALKEAGTTHWASPNAGATNSSGFTALPGGSRYDNGAFYELGFAGCWWTVTPSVPGYAWYLYLTYDSEYMNKPNANKTNAFSVRCIRN